MRAILSLLWIATLAVCSGATEPGATNQAASDTNPGVPLQSKQPQTFAELLAVPPADLESVDIARINLLCAEGLRGSEQLDVQQCLETLEAWAGHVHRETDRNFHHFAEHPEEFKNALPYYRIGMLGTVLAEDLRIRYNPELEEVANEGIKTHALERWNKFFTDSGDVFIHGLLSEKHHGSCASMPFLYAAIGRRLGYPVTIAARKHHLYARYDEGNGEHLNIEATEHRGFSTPSDEEFRTGWPQMTEEEIRGMGWLRPLGNKEVLAICLLNRSSCLRSMGRYEEANRALDLAARYHPDTRLARLVLEKNRNLNRDLATADRWDQLWGEVENQLIPSAGAMAEHFRNRKVETQLLMNQSTNISEIEKSVRGLKEELARYRAEISDDPAKVQAAFGTPRPSVEQQQFFAMLAELPQPGGIRIPREQVPPEYWQGVPPDLQKRLAKLTSAQEITEEMNVFRNEDMWLRNLDAQQTAHYAGEEASLPPLWRPQEHFKVSQIGVRPESLPATYRDMEVPPELQKHLVSRVQNLSANRETAALDEIRRFEGDKLQRRLTVEAIQKRRLALDQQPLTHAPTQVQYVATAPEQAGGVFVPESAPSAPTEPVLHLRPEAKFDTKAATNQKGKP